MSEGSYGNKLAPGEAGPSTSRAASAAPQPQSLKVTDYLVGPQLDDALAAGQELVISWPFADGRVSDFMQAEALWYVRPLSPLRPLSPHFYALVYHRTTPTIMRRWELAVVSAPIQEIRPLHRPTTPTRPKRITRPPLPHIRSPARRLRTYRPNILRAFQRRSLQHPRPSHGSALRSQRSLRRSSRHQ